MSPPPLHDCVGENYDSSLSTSIPAVELNTYNGDCYALNDDVKFVVQFSQNRVCWIKIGGLAGWFFFLCLYLFGCFLSFCKKRD